MKLMIDLLKKEIGSGTTDALTKNKANENIDGTSLEND